MKKIMWHVLCISLFLFIPTLISGQFCFWVSPTGNDANPGTKNKPFKTLYKARDAVRNASQSTCNKGDVTVYLYGGTYRLEKPFELTALDSGKEGHCVIYRSVCGEHPIIAGSVPVTGWELFDEALGIYRASIGLYKSRQLYVNGQRAERSRTTPYPSGFRPSFPLGIEFLPTDLNPVAWKNPATWTNVTDIEAVIETQWKMMRVPLTAIFPSLDPIIPGLITLVEPAWTNANVYYDSETNMPGIWSFWQVTRFENALQFLNGPGQWCLDSNEGFVYYIPRPGENINMADVELPILETLIDAHDVHDVRFEGITFSYATWNGPSEKNGYVADQSGMILVGSDHKPNFIGHDPDVVASHANIYLKNARNICFKGNTFMHLGGIGIHFDQGSRCNSIKSNLFTDISSSAILLGGVSIEYAHPKDSQQVLSYNTIFNNMIRDVCVEYVDAAGVLIGFSRKTHISHNTISNVPWSALAIGWGWGLFDKGSFPGLPHATSGQWGMFDTLTPNYGCVIEKNRFEHFLNVLWDGGAIYSTGRQGPDFKHGLLIKENVASNKRPSGGGNTWYTDGGSRYVTLEKNISYDNAIGEFYFGPPPKEGDPLPYDPLPSLANGLPYGDDSGGCVTYGDIAYCGNYWRQSPIPQEEIVNNVILKMVLGFLAYSEEGFFNICPFILNGISYPTNLLYKGNRTFKTVADLPKKILKKAGVCKRPKTISKDEWEG